LGVTEEAKASREDRAANREREVVSMKTIRSGQQCWRHVGAKFFDTARLRATAVVLTALPVCAATVAASPAEPV
jgi:hypothetical protein